MKPRGSSGFHQGWRRASFGCFFLQSGVRCWIIKWEGFFPLLFSEETGGIHLTHTQPTFDRPCLPSVSQGQPRVGHCKECGISLNSTHGFPLTLYSVISWNHILCSIRSNCSSVITPTLSEETFHVLSLPINPYPKKDFRICYAAMICHLMGTQHRVMDFFNFFVQTSSPLEWREGWVQKVANALTILLRTILGITRYLSLALCSFAKHFELPKSMNSCL